MMRLALVAALALAGCATSKQPVAAAPACQLSTEQQNRVLEAAVARHFGQQRHGYNTQVKVPRARDARGRMVLEAYRIYPMTWPEPETPPPGRELTVVVDPCAGKAVRVFGPA